MIRYLSALIFVLCLCSVAWGSISYTDRTISSGTVPQIINVSGAGVVGTDTNYARYTLSGTLPPGSTARKLAVSTGFPASVTYPSFQYAIQIPASWVYLNLGNDSVTFGSANGNNQGGILLSGAHIIIDGGYVLHVPTGARYANGADPTWDPADPVYNALCFRTTGYDLEIKNVDEARVKGHSITYSQGALGAVIRGGTYGINIHNNVLINEMYAYDDRQYFLATAYLGDRMSSAAIPAGYSYNARIAHNTIYDYAHTAVYVSGASASDGAKVLVDSNTIVIDVRNNRYPTHVVGDNSGYYGCANAYGIQLTLPAVGSRVSGNQISSGSTYLGGQGLHIVGATGNDYKQIEVTGNHYNMHQGYETGFQTDFHPVAVKFRQRMYGIWQHHDTVIYTADTSIRVNVHGVSYAPKGHAIQVQQWNPTMPQYATFENNVYQTIARTNVNTSAYLTDVVNFEDFNNTPVPEVVWRNNKLISGVSSVYAWGQGGDGGAGHLTIENDTISKTLGAFSAYQFTFKQGCIDCADIGTENRIRDVYFGSNTSPSDISYEWNGTTTGGSQDLTFQRTLSLVVKGGVNGLPVSGASVTVTNGTDAVVASGATGENGVFAPLVDYLYYSRTATNINYNDFIITASMATDNIIDTITVNWNAYTDTLTLANTSGTGLWPNTADELEYIKAVADGGNSQWSEQMFISGPKHQIVYLNNTPRSIVVYKNTTGYTSTFNEMTRWVDGVATDSMDLNAVNANYVDNENSMTITDGDTIVMVVNNGAYWGTSVPIIRFNANSNPISYIDARTFTVPYAGVGVPTSIGGRNLMLEYRGSSTNTSDIMYSVSTDAGDTWSTATRIGAGFNINTRTGIESWGTGKAVVASVTGVNGASPQLKVWIYDGSTWTALADPIPGTYGGAPAYPHREFGFACTNDSTIHLLLSDTAATTTNSRLLHLYYKIPASGTGSWAYSVPYQATSHIGNTSEQKRLSAHLAVARSSGNLRAAIGIPEGNGTDQALVSYLYLGAGTWDDSVVITQEPTDSVGFCTASTPTPVSSGDRVAFGFKARNDDSANVFYVAGIRGSGVAPAPDTAVITVNDSSVAEGGTLTFIVQLSPALTDALTYYYTTTLLTAETDDFTGISGTSTIAAGNTRDTLTVTTTNDATVESDETLQLTLSSFSYNRIRRTATDSIAVGTILNNDTPPVSSKTRTRIRK